MKRIGYCLLLMAFFAYTEIAVAQSPVPNQTGKNAEIGIYTMLTKAASNNDDDEVYEKYASRLPENKDISDWLFVDVRFPVLAPTSNDAWERWVDDLEVRLEIIGYSRQKNGARPVLLHFTQPLNPVFADGKTHHVRFFIPPYVLYRYLITPTKNKSEVRKRIGQLYILATVSWRGTPVSYITSSAKNAPSKRSILDNMRRMRERRGNQLSDTIFPAEYTPWAGRSMDRFESMKINIQQRSR